MEKSQSDIAVSVKNVGKTFKVFMDKGTSLKEKVLFSNRRRYENREVLKDISLEIKKGEAVGFIGHNGCGKSTLLKLLTRIMYPDTGSITVNGRVSSLIELGAGFHPDMSGRENIYTNAAIFGLSKKEIDKRLNDIINFSELEDFIDNPVRTYSSGMYMRLAFSVAINVDADVLMIDEILAVGDVAFQAKCFNKLREIKANGTTIVIVSHSLGQIESICDRSIWIHDGYVRAEGAPQIVDMQYLDFMSRSSAVSDSQNKPDASNPDENSDADNNTPVQEAASENETAAEQSEKHENRWGNGLARIERLTFTHGDGMVGTTFVTGDDIIITVDYTVKEPVKNAVFGIGLFDRSDVQCYGTNTRIDRMPEFSLEKSGQMQLVLKNVSLLSGEYYIDLAIESDSGIPVDYFRHAAVITMTSTIGDVGITRINHEWKY